jgi:hypothetical protein
MTAKQFVTRMAWLNLPFLLVVCALNYWIDASASHHLPGEAGFFPRTTVHSPLSKLHYLSIKKPDTIYFGSSRTEIGLPADSGLVGGGQVYNAGMLGASFGQIAPFIGHTLAFVQPKQMVIGIDFASFTTKPGKSDLDLSLLSSSPISYFAKRIPHDLVQALSLSEIQNSIHSIRAWLGDRPYDGTPEVRSMLGQPTAVRMRDIIDGHGTSNKAKAFQKKVALAFAKPSGHIADEKAWRLFEDLLAEVCQKNIITRIYIHPVHALVTDALRQNGAWPRLEQWKTDLANAISRHQHQHQHCDVKAFDFSGYNSVTTESIRGLSPTTTLHHYWEASHYKSNVGELTLKRLFAPDATDLPPDFGRELRQDTVAQALAAMRDEQARYLASHKEEIALSQQWAAIKKPAASAAP